MDDLPLRRSHQVLVQVGTAARPTGWQAKAADFPSEDGKTTLHGYEVVKTGAAPWQIVNADVTLTVTNPALTKATLLDAAGYPARLCPRHPRGRQADGEAAHRHDVSGAGVVHPALEVPGVIPTAARAATRLSCASLASRSMPCHDLLVNPHLADAHPAVLRHDMGADIGLGAGCRRVRWRRRTPQTPASSSMPPPHFAPAFPVGSPISFRMCSDLSPLMRQFRAGGG